MVLNRFFLLAVHVQCYFKPLSGVNVSDKNRIGILVKHKRSVGLFCKIMRFCFFVLYIDSSLLTSEGLPVDLSNDRIVELNCTVYWYRRYWGMQSKIERFIHDMALRNTMLKAHKQVVSPRADLKIINS